MKKYDIAVVIGRMQPFHLGHKAAIQQALTTADHVFVLLGSCNKAPDIKNPFTFEQRRAMIVGEFGAPPSSVELSKISFYPLNDHPYSNANWIAQVQGVVADLIEESSPLRTGPAPKICLVGCNKDSSSGYLSWFPQWDFVHLDAYCHGDKCTVHATDIRKQLFEKKTFNLNILPLSTQDFLANFVVSDMFQNLCKEHEHITNYKEQFKTMKYPPIHVTSDAVVICKGHVLVIKRRSHPGKGLWALPGGFVQQDEWVVEGIIRELQEETKIKVDESILKSALKGTHVFDAPNRSLRGRTITHAGLFVLHCDELPWVLGSDDAEKAKWIPFNEVYEQPQIFFEDHAHIISYMVNRPF